METLTVNQNQNNANGSASATNNNATSNNNTIQVQNGNDKLNNSNSNNNNNSNNLNNNTNNKCNLIVNYLPQSVKENDFNALFSKIGTLKSCRLMFDRQTGKKKTTFIWRIILQFRLVVRVTTLIVYMFKTKLHFCNFYKYRS